MPKITFSPSRRSTEVRAIHCPDCGERLRNIVLDGEDCAISGLKFRCKRCGKYHDITVEPTDHKTK